MSWQVHQFNRLRTSSDVGNSDRTRAMDPIGPSACDLNEVTAGVGRPALFNVHLQGAMQSHTADGELDRARLLRQDDHVPGISYDRAVVRQAAELHQMAATGNTGDKCGSVID